jgi:hypothetical protein
MTTTASCFLHVVEQAKPDGWHAGGLRDALRLHQLGISVEVLARKEEIRARERRGVRHAPCVRMKPGTTGHTESRANRHPAFGSEPAVTQARTRSGLGRDASDEPSVRVIFNSYRSLASLRRDSWKRKR